MEPETAADGQQNAGQNQQQQQAPPAPPPDVRQISASEYQDLLATRSQLAELRAQQAVEADRRERARLDAMAAEGRHKEAMTELRTSLETRHAEAVQQYEDLQRQVLGDKLTATIANAFAGREFVGETAEERAIVQADLTRLLESQFEAVRGNDGRVVVRDRNTGADASAALKELLNGKRFALYFKSKGGGAGAQPAAGRLHAPTITPGGEFLAANAAEWKGRQVQGFGFTRVG